MDKEEQKKIHDNPQEDLSEDESGGFSENGGVSDENPFGEVFDREDVVNTKTEPEEIKDSGSGESDPDPESIINYDDEKRKEKYFKYKFGQSEKEPKSRFEQLSSEFEDFLIVRKISGNMKGLGGSGRIPAERMTSSDKSVKIEDDPSASHKNGETTVAIHKNENDEITHIEVFCSCGEKTIIQLDYEDEDMPDIEAIETEFEDKIEEEIEESKIEKEREIPEDDKEEDPDEDIDMDFVDFENVKRKKKEKETEEKKKETNTQSES